MFLFSATLPNEFQHVVILEKYASICVVRTFIKKLTIFVKKQKIICSLVSKLKQFIKGAIQKLILSSCNLSNVQHWLKVMFLSAFTVHLRKMLQQTQLTTSVCSNFFLPGVNFINTKCQLLKCQMLTFKCKTLATFGLLIKNKQKMVVWQRCSKVPLTIFCERNFSTI